MKIEIKTENIYKYLGYILILIGIVFAGITNYYAFQGVLYGSGPIATGPTLMKIVIAPIIFVFAGLLGFIIPGGLGMICYSKYYTLKKKENKK